MQPHPRKFSRQQPANQPKRPNNVQKKRTQRENEAYSLLPVPMLSVASTTATSPSCRSGLLHFTTGPLKVAAPAATCSVIEPTKSGPSSSAEPCAAAVMSRLTFFKEKGAVRCGVIRRGGCWAVLVHISSFGRVDWCGLGWNG